MQAGGGGFDSRMLHLAYGYGCMWLEGKFFARKEILARSSEQVERLAVNQDVVGSSPTVPADVTDINVGNI